RSMSCSIPFRPEKVQPGIAVTSVSGTDVRHLRRYAQVYLGAGSRLAPDVELRAKLLGAFAHTRQAKMARSATGVEQRRRNSLAIITDADLQPGVRVGEFDLYDLGRSVPERVAKRLAADQ